MCGSCGGKGIRNVIGNRRRPIVTPQNMSVKNRTIKPKEMKKPEEKETGISLARREVLRKHRLAVQRALGK